MFDRYKEDEKIFGWLCLKYFQLPLVIVLFLFVVTFALSIIISIIKLAFYICFLVLVLMLFEWTSKQRILKYEYLELKRWSIFSRWCIFETTAKEALPFPDCQMAICYFGTNEPFDILPLGRYKMLTHQSIIDKMKLLPEIHISKEKPIGAFSREFIRSALVGKTCICNENVDCTVKEKATADFEYRYIKFEKI